MIRRQFRNETEEMTLAQKVSVNALKKNILKYTEDEAIEANKKRQEKMKAENENQD